MSVNISIANKDKLQYVLLMTNIYQERLEKWFIIFSCSSSTISTKWHHIRIVMDHCKGPKVFEYIIANHCNITEKSIIDSIKQITSTLDHLHHFGYVHSSLTPDNLRYEDVQPLSIMQHQKYWQKNRIINQQICGHWVEIKHIEIIILVKMLKI